MPAMVLKKAVIEKAGFQEKKDREEVINKICPGWQ